MIKNLGLLAICFVAQLEAVFEIEKCYGDLGCFEVTGDFFDPLNRPFQILPSHPDSIGTKFLLYTLKNKNQPQFLDIDAADFNSTLGNFGTISKTIKIIIHGFRENEAQWMKDAKDEYLRLTDMNVIFVVWENGASIPYLQASSNTRVVGAQVAKLIRKLQQYAGIKMRDVHLIGFSLGAHVAGYAGQALNGQIERISGLDPAGPLFEGMKPVVRLDQSDAKYVDVIHTDAKKLIELSFGAEQTMGHVDFYPNGGHDQPECPHTFFKKVTAITWDLILEGLDQAGETATCRHSRAKWMFVDSIWSTWMIGYPCPSYEEFLNAECGTCGKEASYCSVAGSPARQFPPLHSLGNNEVKLYYTTRASKRFMLFHYHVTLKTPKEDSGVSRLGLYVYIKTVRFGSVTATLNGEFGQSVTVNLTRKDQVFDSDKEYSFLATSRYSLGEIKSILIDFQPSSTIESVVNLKLSVKDTLSVQEVYITDMYKLLKQRLTQDKQLYCSGHTTLPATYNKKRPGSSC